MRTIEKSKALKFSIYALSDPRRPNFFKYIGVTEKSLRERLKGHIHASQRKPYNAFKGWINELLLEGLEPQMNFLEFSDGSRVENDERFYIAMLRDDLLNSKHISTYRRTSQYLFE